MKLLLRNLLDSLLSTIAFYINNSCQEQRPFAILMKRFGLQGNDIVIIVNSQVYGTSGHR